MLVLAALLASPAPGARAATRVVGATADAYVDASTPKQRFGSASTLRVGSAPTRTAYLRFDLSTVTEPVARATLVLQGTETGSFDVRRVVENWNERSITFQNAPVAGAVLGTAQTLGGTERRVDISGVTAGRMVAVALTSLATPALSFASREAGASGPRLELETADAGAPAVTLTSPAPGSMTNQVQPTFAGAAGTAAGDSATVTVRVYAGTAATGTPSQTLSTTAAGGAWSVAAGAPLTPGVHTAQAQQTDDAGNVGRSLASTFTVDTTPPAVTLTSPAAGSAVGPTPSFAGAAGTATGDTSAITVRVYAGTAATGTPVQILQAQAAGGSWTVTPTTALAEGTYTARAEQADVAGNTGASAAATFGVAGSPPPPADYRAAVMSDSPRAYWRFGETSGLVAADETANGLSGSYLNGAALGQPGAVSGDANTAVALDGANDTVRVPNASALNSSGAMSIETWIKPPALPASSATIARKEGQYLLRLSASGAVTFRLWKGGAINEAVTPGAVSAGAWAHVVAAWDGATMRVYVNGSVRASRALAAPADVSTQDLYVGSSYNSYDFLAAGVDETAVYGAALSAARVTTHFEAAGGSGVAPTVRLLAPAGGSTMDATPNFGGAATPGAGPVTVRVYGGTSATGTPVQSLPAAVQSAGTFSVVAAPLVSGTYTAVAEQAAGRSAPSTFAVSAEGAPAILAAGDIAACDTFGDEATAALLDRLAGTVATLGDHVYEDGTASDFANCYDPTWGRHKARTRPTVGDHEYRTPGALPYFNYFGAAAGDPAKGYQSYDLGGVACRLAQRELLAGRRLPRRLAAGAVAARRPGGPPRAVHARDPAQAALQLGRDPWQQHHVPAVLAGAVRLRCRPRAQRGRPRVRALRAADTRRRRRSRGRHPPDHGRHRRSQPLRVRRGAAQQRGTQQRRLRRHPGHAAPDGLRLALRARSRPDVLRLGHDRLSLRRGAQQVPCDTHGSSTRR